MLGLTPADQQQLMSLMGTMTPEGIMGQLEALNNQRQEELAQGSRDAATAAQTAQSDYSQLASAPPPDAAPENFIPQLASNVASVISKNPAYGNRAHEKGSAKQNDLMEQRRNNLLALKDIYGQKAEHAEKAHDLQSAEDFRLKHEKIQVQLSKLAEDQKQQHEIELQKLRNSGALDVAKVGAQSREDVQKMKAPPSADEYDEAFRNLVKTTGGGNEVLDTTRIPAKMMPAALKWAAEQKMLPLGAQGMAKLGDVDTARANIRLMRDKMASLLPKTPGEARVRGPMNAIGAALGTAPEVRAFKVMRTAAIQQLKALAGGVGSGLRINQAEIAIAVLNDIPDPSGWTPDTIESATKKLDTVDELLNNTERPFTSRSMQTETAGTGAEAPASAAAPPAGKVLMRTKKGASFYVDSAKVEEAKAHGLVPAN